MLAAQCFRHRAWLHVRKPARKGRNEGNPRLSRQARRLFRPSQPAPRTLEEERYRLALESINHGHYDWEIDKNTIYYSETAAHDLRHGGGAGSSRPRSRPSGCTRTISRITCKALIAHLKGEVPRFSAEYRYLDNHGQLALGAPERHRAAPARRPRLPHGRRHDRHHRRQARRSRSSRRRAPRSSRRARTCARCWRT